MINRITILGRLVNNPEMKITSGGTEYTRAVIANEQAYKDKKHTNFVEVVAWGGLAKNFANYCEKGRKVLVDGRLEIKKNKDGEKTYTNISIMAENIDFLEKPKENFREVEDDDTPF